MKRMKQKEFAFRHGEHCPFCFSRELDTLEEQRLFLEVQRQCLDCGKKFTEIHKITGYKFKKEVA